MQSPNTVGEEDGVGGYSYTNPNSNVTSTYLEKEDLTIGEKMALGFLFAGKSNPLRKSDISAIYTNGGLFGQLLPGRRPGQHRGIDEAAPNGTRVNSVAFGRVTFAGENAAWGKNLVRISHGAGISTYYAHLSSVNVKVGQIVSSFTKIGEVGSGHLHFGVTMRNSNTTYVDPVNILPKWISNFYQ